MLAAIPCDLLTQAYCTQPGAAYPWHAVRRFVHENQGLMKRMYGDVRHISVLRDEILNNEIDVDDIEAATDRYSRDGYNRRASKLMHHREDFENFKVNDVLREPHFRPVTSSTTTTTTSTTTSPTGDSTTTTMQPPVTTTAAEKIESTVVANDEEVTTIEPTFSGYNSTTLKKEEADVNEDSVADSITNVAANIDQEDVTTKPSPSMLAKQIAEDDEVTTAIDEDELVDIINIELNSVFETTSDASVPNDLNGSNIEIVESPQLGLDNGTTEKTAISSTTPKPETKGTSTTLTPQSSANSNSTMTTKTTTTTTTIASTTTTLKPETTAERSPAKQQRKPFVPSNSKYQHQRPQQLQKVESTISAKLKLKINPTQATPARTTTSFPSIVRNNTGSATSNTTTTPLTSTKMSPFKSQLNKNYNRYTTTHNNKYNAPSPGTSASGAPIVQPIKPNAELLLGEKIRKPAANVTPAAAAASNKPIMKDGQLFQDTMKQEPAPTLNVRGVNACPVKEEVVAPFWANNTRGEILALLNLYPFEQYVHWEKCTHEHKQMYCREGCRCEQQYRLHRLLAYDPHNECRGIFSDWFRFPSCCICKCYNIPLDFRATSRSPRSEGGAGETSDYRHPIEIAEEQVKNAIYEHATEDWYRPKDDIDLFEG
uniref:Spaetzle domain-containing protein n=1 Tax=Stomoxys calcitrans TaxID=35570 RepID=A0A1I8QCC5_STOCA